jgi:hypothetical protein
MIPTQGCGLSSGAAMPHPAHDPCFVDPAVLLFVLATDFRGVNFSAIVYSFW